MCEKKNWEELDHEPYVRNIDKERQGPLPFQERPEPWVFPLGFQVSMCQLWLYADQNPNYILPRPTSLTVINNEELAKLVTSLSSLDLQRTEGHRP